MHMDFKLKLIGLLNKLPEKLLPNSLKLWMDRELDVKLAEVKMNVRQGNWRLVQEYEDLKAMLDDPRLSEEKREEFRIKIEEFSKRLDKYFEEQEKKDRELEEAMKQEE